MSAAPGFKQLTSEQVRKLKIAEGNGVGSGVLAELIDNALDLIASEIPSNIPQANISGLVAALAAKLDASQYVEDSFSATFDQAVGAKTVVVRKIGKLVQLEIPSGSTADGGGAAIASGATDVPAAYRPAADISFPVVVTDNGALVFGKLVLSAAGQLSFSVGAAGGNFTDDQPAGFDRCALSYTVA